MNRRAFLSSIPLLVLFLSACGPHHKSHPPSPGSQMSGWRTYIYVGPYEVYFHKSWSDKQVQCLRSAVEAHWASWGGSRRATLRIGAHHWGRIWVHGAGSNLAGTSTCADSGPGMPIHVYPGDHRLHNLNHAIDYHQDPFQENGIDKPARAAEVHIDDEAAVNDAFAKQQFLGCH